MNGLIPVRLVGGTGTAGLWGLVCARGAQQQAAQREERQGKESGKNDLMHAGHYSPPRATPSRTRLGGQRESGYSGSMMQAFALFIATLTSLILLAGLLLRPARTN